MTPRPSPYGWLMLAGIILTICFWSRLARRDDRLLIVYVAALIGAFLGAKLVYLLAEGWLHFGAPDMWLQLATGKSILGALLGGYLAVELAKKWVGYPGVTGDWFAAIAPAGIIVGRIGCLLHGCCLGVACRASWFTLNDSRGLARWPAVPMEILFNALALICFFLLRRYSPLIGANSSTLPERGCVRGGGDQPQPSKTTTPSANLPGQSPARSLFLGQHFHLYLIAYGAFRFLHEFVREEPHIVGPFSGYQLAALAVLALGLGGFLRRMKHPSTLPAQPA